MAGPPALDVIAAYESGLAAAGYEVGRSEVVDGRHVIGFQGRRFEGEIRIDEQGRRLQVVESSHRRQ